MEMIKAMKGGMVGFFSHYAWTKGKPEKHGWRKVGTASEAVMVESEQIDLVKTDISVTEISIDNDDVLYPTDDEIREFLTSKGIKFHPKLGTEKLRDKYDANKE